MLTNLLFFAVIFLLSLWLLSGFLTKKKKKSGENYPPSIPSIPVLGSLPFIAWNAAGHIPRYFLKKSEELGPIFTFKIGNKKCLVLNSFKSIEEAFVSNSTIFAGRQVFLHVLYATGQATKGIAVAPFNAYWKYHQKVSLSILREFGYGKSNIMDKRISQEVTELVKSIKSTNGRSFNPKDLALKTSANIIHQMLFADRFSHKNEINPMYRLANEFSDSTSYGLIFDIAPWLRFFPYFRQMIENTANIHKKLFGFIKEFANDDKSGDSDVTTFVSRYLEKETLDCDMEQLFFILRDLVVAGMDTTAATVLWSLLFLANHQTIQSKLQKEIDEMVPRSRLPSYEDKKNLPYVEAFILEVQRIKTLFPLAIPRVTTRDSHISGFFVPVGTLVLANLYAAHMDPTFWGDPENFRPERFLDEKFNIVNKDRCIPFSLGRRSCLGEALARQELFQIVSGLVQNFVVLPPEGRTVLDDQETVGLLMKPSDFQVRMRFRAP